MKLTALALGVSAGLFLAACQSAPDLPPADAQSKIYFQRAQTASDQSRYDVALKIYETFLAQRPDADRADVFAARYEVAFLLSKEGKLTESLAKFQDLLNDYSDLDKSAGAPAWVKVMAEKKFQELKDRTKSAS